METFILNTALDYDIDVDIVRRIYNQHYANGKFYEKLEEYIEQRSKLS